LSCPRTTTAAGRTNAPAGRVAHASPANASAEHISRIWLLLIGGVSTRY